MCYFLILIIQERVLLQPYQLVEVQENQNPFPLHQPVEPYLKVPIKRSQRDRRPILSTIWYILVSVTRILVML